MMDVRQGVTPPRRRNGWFEKVDIGMRVGFLIVVVFSIIQSRC